MTKTRRILITIAVLLLLGACGGGDDSGGGGSGGGGGATVSIAALDNSFDPAELSVPSGEVTVEFTNDGENPHTFTSKELDFDTGTLQGGESETVTFEAPSETTPFECTIHGASGMTGEIVPE
jgi:cytochrome c oxidase subunit II